MFVCASGYPPQELQTCVGIDVDPTAHRTAAATLAPLLSQPGAPTLHQLTGNYRCVSVFFEGGEEVCIGSGKQTGNK